ncbi:response regulator [Arcticibacter sp.]|jgi:two-component system cell cycle response regulator DivK|uniref:response regulator n=1 Tax=Arcticibacter sp. TaxID=1872630 RepID=UPI00388FF5EA
MKRILIFDDDADILDILIYLLEENGWVVHTRRDCSDLLATVERCEPDIILMDNWIPEEGGIVATQLLKSNERYKDIPVIYFSANNNIKALAEEAGADSWLAKPFDLNDLEAMLNTYKQKASD